MVLENTVIIIIKSRGNGIDARILKYHYSIEAIAIMKLENTGIIIVKSHMKNACFKYLPNFLQRK